MEKKYVWPDNNKCPSIFTDFIKIGALVIVKDGSYMTDENGKPVHGINFVTDKAWPSKGQFELLKVIDINKPFPTDIGTGECLLRWNNCQIEGFDGKKYYCSLVNIIQFKD